jgi:hypothetical protein
MPKAKKWFDGMPWCSTCYAREFVRRTCSSCATQRRVHRSHSLDAPCHRCVRARETCLRCDRFVERAARRVGGRLLCASCGSATAGRATCPTCGKDRAPVLSDGSVAPCRSCRDADRKVTCASCRRFRLKSSTDSSRCQACEVAPDTTHGCPDCGTPQPGGGAGRCRACLGKQAARARAQFLVASVERPWLRALLASVLADAIANSRHMRIDLTIARAADLVTRIDTRLVDQSELTGAWLLREIGSDALRSHLLVGRALMRAMPDAGPDTAARVRESHTKLCERLATTVPDAWQAVVHAFEAHLTGRHMTLQTRRVYLRAAFGLSAHTTRRPSDVTATDVAAFLATAPGWRASLGPFVTFLRDEFGFCIAMPDRAGAPRAARLRRLVLRAPTRSSDARDALAIALDVSPAHLEKLHAAGRIEASGGRIRLDGPVVVWLTGESAALARLWLRHHPRRAH